MLGIRTGGLAAVTAPLVATDERKTAVVFFIAALFYRLSFVVITINACLQDIDFRKNLGSVLFHFLTYLSRNYVMGVLFKGQLTWSVTPPTSLTLKKPKLYQDYKRNITPLKTAECEKYRHKASFINGQNNSLFPGEKRISESVSKHITLSLMVHNPVKSITSAMSKTPSKNGNRDIVSIMRKVRSTDTSPEVALREALAARGLHLSNNCGAGAAGKARYCIV